MGKSGTRKGVFLSIVFGIISLFILASCGGDDVKTSPFSKFSAPVAEFSASSTTGQAPLTVTFSDMSTGAISTWSWDFGDGVTSVVQNPSHTYAEGTYTVSLTVTGPGGSDSNVKVDHITVTPPIFTDNFNRADENPLSNGVKWVKANDAAVNNLKLVGNEVVHTQGTDSPALMYWDEPTAQDQFSEAEITGNHDSVIAARGATAQWDDYEVNVVGNTWFIYKTTNGVGSLKAGPLLSTVTLGDKIRIECTGSNPTTIKGYKNGVEVISYVDSISPHTSGRVGLGMFGINSKWDNWEGGNLP